MVEESPASTISHESRRPKTGAERQRAYRLRKRQQRQLAPGSGRPPAGGDVHPTSSVTALPVRSSLAVTPVTLQASPPSPVTKCVTDVTPSSSYATGRRSINAYLLIATAFALAGVGVTMNGWFAKSLGSTDTAGLLFLAIGVASDLAGLAVPPIAVHLWQTHQRVIALISCLVWFTTFLFAFTSAIGFASLNVSDVMLLRASRVTPTVTVAQDALRDAITSRNRECSSGVGRFCRDREQAVTDRQRALDAALLAAQHVADPQADAAVKILAWLSGGAVKPAPDDFAMFRLVLLALLPQIGGILLMIGRSR